jgi:hypothetical protein
MERFRVPRGGQTWECPMYEPDILAAANAIRACVEGYRVTGDSRWLHDGVYWAETGVPFVYLWSLPDRPMMLGATIPVFGSTFYTHSWLGMPVQWCGLVYSYELWRLAGELERAGAAGLRAASGESPLRASLGFRPQDWKRLVELITVSALHQQIPEGAKAGTYPDSISDFSRRNPAFLNPEDILVNLFALGGHDPDIRTARQRSSEGDWTVSSGVEVEELSRTGRQSRFLVRPYAGDGAHVLVSGVLPSEVRVDGQVLVRSETPVRREPGWWVDEGRRLAFLVLPAASGPVRKVELTE